jgi:hypothetical protein
MANFNLVSKLFPAKTQEKIAKTEVENFYKELEFYKPAWRTWNGALYESELVRAAIDSIARHASKLKISFEGNAQVKFKTQASKNPNSWNTWSQLLYRVASILYVQNNCLLIPIFDKFGDKVGIFPIMPSESQIVVSKETGVEYIRFTYRKKKLAIELAFCGILTRFQLYDELFGESNKALGPTLGLIDLENQGVAEAIKSSASYRFMARLAILAKDEDLKKEKEEFNKTNFSADADSGGLLLFNKKFEDIKQIQSNPYTLKSDELDHIRTNVFNYFGVNEDIIQNKAYGDKFTAFYEGCIEWFSIQLSEVVTNMIFTVDQQGYGNKILFTSSRLAFMSNTEKLNISEKLLDRGVLSINEVREIWNLTPIEGGDEHIVRGEYKNTDEITEEPTAEEPAAEEPQNVEE